MDTAVLVPLLYWYCTVLVLYCTVLHLHPVHDERHLLAQALGEVVQLLALHPAEVVVAFAEPEVYLNNEKFASNEK